MSGNSKVLKKRKKKFNLKKLNSAVKSLLEQKNDDGVVEIQPNNNNNNNNLSIVKSEKKPHAKKDLPWLRQKLIDVEDNGDDYTKNSHSDDNNASPSPGTNGKETIVKDGKTYTMSKENKLIPKLNDDEIMEKHKQADENMREAWMNIIDKYSVNENDENYRGLKSDVIDIQTGQIVEDNGHLRNLHRKNRKKMMLVDIYGGSGGPSDMLDTTDDLNRELLIRNDKYVSRILNGWNSSSKSHEKNKGNTKKIDAHAHADFGSDSDSDSDYIDASSESDESDIWGEPKKVYTTGSGERKIGDDKEDIDDSFIENSESGSGSESEVEYAMTSSPSSSSSSSS